MGNNGALVQIAVNRCKKENMTVNITVTLGLRGHKKYEFSIFSNFLARQV